MKRILTLMLVLCMTVTLCACGEKPCSHELQPATCELPATCSLCGYAEGEAAGHTWSPAGCTAPASCSVCGKTEGEPLGHSFTFATSSAPETCTLCGETRGDPVSVTTLSAPDGYDFLAVGLNSSGELAVCSTTKLSSGVEVRLTGADGEVIRSDRTGRYWSRSSVAPFYGFSTIDGYKQSRGSDGVKRYPADFTLVSFDGNEVFHDTLYVTVGNYPIISLDNASCVVTIYENNTGTVLLELDVSDAGYALDPAISAALPADTADWEYKEHSGIPGRYLVATPDKSQWAYADAEGNILAAYADCGSFNPYGYALASYDRSSYFIIDKDFNVVGEAGPGVSGHIYGQNGAALALETADGSTTLLFVR